MRPLRDPECAELNHLMAACELMDKDIIEIGCGDGKFTRQYAGISRRTIGIDPELADLQLARQDKTAQTQRISYLQAIGEYLPFPAQTIDIAIFACSL